MNDRLASLASARPMVVVASAFIFGILSKEYLQIGAIIFICLIPLASLFAFVPHPKVQQWSLLLLIALSGGLRLLIHDMPRPASLGDYPIKTSENYYVRSIVLDIGETRKGTPKYTLAPLSIDDNRIVAGRMILYAKDLALLPQMGDTLSAEMNLQKPRNRRNPNDFDYQQYLFNQGIFLQGFIADTNSVEMSTAEGFIPDRFINSMRGTIKSHFIKYLSPRSAGIMSALILGERSDVNDETKNDFANTGVIHVLAVSGLHVGYVSLILITILGMLRLPYRPKLVLVIIGLVCYVILTGGAASVMRASMMAALILLASMLERKTDVFNILATAAFLILLIDPSQIKSIGFQLSFSAVFSIVTLFPELRSWIPKVQFQRQVILSNFINALVDLFLVSLAAQLGTLALTMYYFQKIPIISLLANLLVVPLIGVIVATGISSLLLGSVFPALAVLWAALLDGVIDFMLLFVQVCARFRWAYYSTGSIQYVEVILLLIAVFAMLKIQGYRLLKLWIILILTWFNLLVWPAVFRPGDMELIMLDVGQGDASIIHTPQGKTIVVDAGSRFSGKDMGRDVISPYLLDRNWKKIDLLVLTHPHNDHMGGAEYLLNQHSVQRVIMPEVEYDSYGYRKLREILDSLKIPVIAAYTGDVDTTLFPLYLRVTGPGHFDHEGEPSNVNNVSIVLQVFYGETSLLLTGDAEQEMEQDQLALGNLLQSDLIKAPHHGSKTSSSPAYIDLVNPDVCLISLGEGNKYRHPSPITIEGYQERGTRIHRTDLEGAIIYTSDGQKWSHFPWKNSK